MGQRGFNYFFLKFHPYLGGMIQIDQYFLKRVETTNFSKMFLKLYTTEGTQLKDSFRNV